MTNKVSRKRPSMPDIEVRERQAKRRLGSDDPACCHCGNSDWRALELHHIAGRAFDSMTVILCKNCHAILTDAQGGHPTIAEDTPTMLDRIGRLLLNLADFFDQLGIRLREFGGFLVQLASSLPVLNGCAS
jgi:hypothetical protein